MIFNINLYLAHTFHFFLSGFYKENISLYTSEWLHGNYYSHINRGLGQFLWGKKYILRKPRHSLNFREVIVAAKCVKCFYYFYFIKVASLMWLAWNTSKYEAERKLFTDIYIYAGFIASEGKYFALKYTMVI